MLHLLSDLTDHSRSLKVKMPTMITQMPTGRIARHSPHPSHRYGPFLHNVARSVVCTFGTGWACESAWISRNALLGQSRVSSLKHPFSANPSHHSLLYLLQDWLHGFPGLFADTSELIRLSFILFFFLFFTFKLSVPCGRLSWLIGTFWAHVK